jgi:hypothetical protein
MDLDIAVLTDPGSPNEDQVVLEWLLWQRKQHNRQCPPGIRWTPRAGVDGRAERLASPKPAERSWPRH